MYLNLANNIGQENTHIVDLAPSTRESVRANLTNFGARPAVVRFEVDAYRLIEQKWGFNLQTRVTGDTEVPFIGPRGKPAGEGTLVHWLRGRRPGPLLIRYSYVGRGSLFDEQRKQPRALPDGWRVTAGTADAEAGIELAPYESREIEITIEAPAQADAGDTHSFNIRAIDQEQCPLGGLTLDVRVR